MGWGFSWRPYVSVAERRAQAGRKMGAMRKKGLNVQPVEIEGRKIARTFWGESWCKHLESFSDFENRLPRGRTYVRNGSVCHLEIASGEVKAIVSGSELYDVKIAIGKLVEKKWNVVKERCSGQISSLLGLLQGKLSNSVMSVVTDRREGLFPLPAEIKMDCSCPDWAVMCKHVAAVLYGVGARLDDQPELLFLLRGVNHEELIEADAAAAAAVTGRKRAGQRRIAESDLQDLFGIEMVEKTTSHNHRHRAKVEKRTPAKPAPHHVGSTKKPGMGATNRQVTESNRAPSSPAGTRAPLVSTRQVLENKRASTTSAQRSSRALTATGANAKIAANATSTANGRPPTGKSVRELRTRLEMSQSQLALLIGVSAASVSNWEQERGRLNLQARTMTALSTITELTKRQAWNRLAKAKA